MAEFAKYAFNKSHAACYAVVAYRTAYLKAYYPTEFMASMLNSYLGNLDKVPQYIDECKVLGIKILAPDINESMENFTGKDNEIRFGLGSIKNVGTEPVKQIVQEREKNGEFKSFTDFCERIADKQVNKKCIESLIKAGAFDEFEQTRSTLLASFEGIIDIIQSSNRKGFSGQVSMFDLGSSEEQEEMNEIKYKFVEQEELPNKELLSLEKEMLGIYISGHPLGKLKEQIEAVTTINSMNLKQIDEQNTTQDGAEQGVTIQDKPKFKDGQNVKYAGIITAIKKKYTKNNKIMAFVTIEDLYGQTEVLVFENAYMKAGKSLVEENIVIVDGRLSIREDDSCTIIANDIKDLSEQKQKQLIIDITNATEEQKTKLRGAIRFFNGDSAEQYVLVRGMQPFFAIDRHDVSRQLNALRSNGHRLRHAVEGHVQSSVLNLYALQGDVILVPVHGHIRRAEFGQGGQGADQQGKGYQDCKQLFHGSSLLVMIAVERR